MRSEIIQIVPSLPPEVCGVADYALVLADQWALAGYQSEFIALSGGQLLPYPVSHITCARARSLTNLLEQADRVVLHNSPYGYAKHGLCTWLGEVLPQWRSAFKQRRLVVMMHEVAPAAPPWAAEFWPGLIQKRIARKLSFAADVVITSSEKTRSQVRSWCRNEPLTLAVFSNVGEVEQLGSWLHRPQSAVAFGSAPQRAKLYKTLLEKGTIATAAFSRAGISNIIDIGPELTTLPNEVAGVGVVPRGIMSADAIRNALSSARYGLVDYPHSFVTKSGVVAAYLANGVVCLNVTAAGVTLPDFREGIEFTSLERLAIGTLDGDAIAAAGHRWYAQHSAFTVAKNILAAIVPGSKD